MLLQNLPETAAEVQNHKSHLKTLENGSQETDSRSKDVKSGPQKAEIEVLPEK